MYISTIFQWSLGAIEDFSATRTSWEVGGGKNESSLEFTTWSQDFLRSVTFFFLCMYIFFLGHRPAPVPLAVRGAQNRSD